MLSDISGSIIIAQTPFDDRGAVDLTSIDSLTDVDLTYGKLGSYATGHEISVDGPLREYYLRDSHDTLDEDAWETEIGWPIFRSDGGS